MSKQQEAMRLALEAMEHTGMGVGKFNRINAACAALRAALAEEALQRLTDVNRQPAAGNGAVA